MAYGDIYREFKDAPNTVLIEDTDDVKVLHTTIDGIVYRFNADWLTDKDLDWFAPIFERHLTDCFNRGAAKAKKEMQSKWNAFLYSMK